MDHPTLNTISLCTGIGMLDKAVELGAELLGIRTKLACCCEWEAYAAACLLARMEESSLVPAPIWCGDLRDFDATSFLGSVDILAAGLPCQPYSCAGKREGWNDERSYGKEEDGPLPNAIRILRECRPALVFLENVPQWVASGWFEPFGESLSSMGYRIAPPLFVTAKSVGTSHKRERVFILAYDPSLFRRAIEWCKSYGVLRGMEESKVNGRYERGPECKGQQRSSAPHDASGHVVVTPGERRKVTEGLAGGTGEGVQLVNGRDPIMGNTRRRHGSEGRLSIHGKGDQSSTGKTHVPEQGCSHMADAECESRSAEQLDETRRWEGKGPNDESVPSGSGIFAPGPAADWARIPEILWPAVESGFRVLVDGVAVVLDESRTDQLRCGGNGVVAVQGAIAFATLVSSVLRDIENDRSVTASV